MTKTVNADAIASAFCNISDAYRGQKAAFLEDNEMYQKATKIEDALFAMLGNVGDDALTMLYLNLRDGRARENGLADQADRAYKARLDQIGAELLKRMQARQNTGFKTQHGTVFREEDFKPSAEDWPTVYRWIVKDILSDILDKAGIKLQPGQAAKIEEAFQNESFDNFEILEKRLKKTTIHEHMEAHSTLNEETGEKVLGPAPPGVRVLREFVARVRVNNKG